MNRLAAGESVRDRLVSAEHGNGSMRRKLVTGRGAAAVVTLGYSLAANNNRGVVYLRLVGEETGIHSMTKRNLSGMVLDSMRSLRAAADAVLAANKVSAVSDSVAVGTGVASQLQRLSELHLAGVLTDDEFTTAKSRLLS